jgi:hypothetical protein
MSPASQRNNHGSDSNLSQDELDRLLSLGGFTGDDAPDGRNSLIDRINDAVLDSGKLSLDEWRSLRGQLREIERLIPHIDLIIDLKDKQQRKRHSEKKKAPAGG